MENKRLIISVGAPIDGTGASVKSVFGRTGDVIAVNGDYNTDQVTEGTNKYFPEAPQDGKEYARKDAAWVEVQGGVISVNGEVGAVVLDGTEIELIEGGGVSVTQAISDLDAEKINEAPQDGKQYARKDAAWSEVTQEGLTNGFNVRFDSDTTPPPSSGRMKFDNSDYSLVTEIYVHKTNQEGGDMTNLFPVFVKNGSNIYAQDYDDATNFVYYNVIADAVDSGDYFTVSVAHVNSSGTLPTAPNSTTSVIIQNSVDSSAYVTSVTAGSNVEVNNSNPQTPIVSAFPTTTAGLLSRTYFTGDTETLGAGTFYKSNRDGKGTVATATQTVNVNDNQKAFFSQDLISEPYPIDTTIYAGAYSGILNGFVSSNGGEQRFTVEIYKTDIDGNPIASGIVGAPTGDLGVTVIAIAQSGLIDLQSGNESQFAITAQLDGDLSLLSTNRVRYHVSAEKVGTTGGAIDITTNYGNTHVAHLDVPIQSLTSTTINDDPIEFAGLATQYDINRSIKANVDTNTIDIGILNNDTVKIATTATDSVKGALYFKDDSASSTLTISTSPIV